jgi:DNA-binding protein HU-beta
VSFIVNKAELIDAIASKTGESKATVDGVLKGLIDAVEENVGKVDKISIPGFVSFQKVDRAARTGRNPRTGETLQIAATSTVKVSAGARLKNSVK